MLFYIFSAIEAVGKLIFKLLRVWGEWCCGARVCVIIYVRMSSFFLFLLLILSHVHCGTLYK